MRRVVHRLKVFRFNADPVEFVFDAPGLMGEREVREAEIALFMSSTVSAVERTYIEVDPTPNPGSTTR